MFVNLQFSFSFFYQTPEDGVIGFLYFDLQLGPFLGSPAVFCLSYTDKIPSTYHLQELHIEIDLCKVDSLYC